MAIYITCSHQDHKDNGTSKLATLGAWQTHLNDYLTSCGHYYYNSITNNSNLTTKETN